MRTSCPRGSRRRGRRAAAPRRGSASEEDGLAERPQRADELPRGAPRRGVEAGGRLVEEDELGIADERHAEVETALLPAGQRLDARVAPSRRARRARSPRRRRADARSTRRTSGAPRARTASAAAPSAGAPRRSARDGHRSPARVDAEHAHLAGVARPVPLEDLHGRGLAGTVGPEEAEDLAGGTSKSIPRTASCRRRTSGGPRTQDRGSRAHAGRGRVVPSPPGENPGSAPVTASAISEQSGWWPDGATGPPTVAPGERLAQGRPSPPARAGRSPTRARARRRDRLGRLARAGRAGWSGRRRRIGDAASALRRVARLLAPLARSAREARRGRRGAAFAWRQR